MFSKPQPIPKKIAKIAGDEPLGDERPDAWERFERAVDAAASRPQCQERHDPAVKKDVRSKSQPRGL